MYWFILLIKGIKRKINHLAYLKSFGRNITIKNTYIKIDLYSWSGRWRVNRVNRFKESLKNLAIASKTLIFIESDIIMFLVSTFIKLYIKLALNWYIYLSLYHLGTPCDYELSWSFFTF